MMSTSAMFSALPVFLFAFFGLVASIVLFIHIIRRMPQSNEIDVEVNSIFISSFIAYKSISTTQASAETTIAEVPLLINAFKEEDVTTTSLPTRPSQHFKTGLVVEHTFASTIPENDPRPMSKSFATHL
ncbi:hypothetical protein MPER_03154 [Moniliophthora perniciosa FA553]|nr:hypothetical protein MPER_03154 [Moniliophthora perniciosa FA553]